MVRKAWVCSFGAAVVGLTAAVGTIAMAQPGHDAKHEDKHGDMHEMQPPEGMTKEQMQACMEAGTPGPMHQWLTEAAGVWMGKCTMWTSPESKPMASECTTTITPMMDGRFTKSETSGDLAGMGPFNGFGLYGYDNVSKKFQSTWIDNCGTGMMVGTGERSSDGKTLTWTMAYNCPIQKKSVNMRLVETRPSKDRMTMAMYGPSPETGKEFKMMEISYTRKGAAEANAEISK